MKRLLDRAAVLEYCSITGATFHRWVAEGRLPGPLPGTNRWDKKAIDRQLDLISGISEDDEENAMLKQLHGSRN